MPLSEKFQFRQIFHFPHKLWSSKPDPLSITNYEFWCGQVMEQRGGISVIYKSLAMAHTKSFYMLEWERDLGLEWDLEDWNRASACAYHGILNTALVEENVKFLMRWYLVPV